MRQQVLTSFPAVPLIHHILLSQHDTRRPQATTTCRQQQNTRGECRGARKREKGGCTRYACYLFSFLFILLTFLQPVASTSPPPPAEHHKRALYGVFIMLSGSYGLTHPPEHEKRDCISPTRRTPKCTPPWRIFLFSVYLLDPHTENATTCRIFCVCVLSPPSHPPNVSHRHHQPTTSPSPQRTTTTALMEDRGWAYIVRPQIFIFFLYTNYNPTH